jgi:iron complex outermembrane recepter protein
LKQIFSAFGFVLLFSTLSFAQRSITGTVTDAETKEPLAGAAVVVKGTTKGAISDANGGFTVDIPANATTLVFSFVGFTSKEVAVGAETTLDVELGTGLELSNVVVIGSRNTTRTKIETPVPVDVIPLKAILNEVGQVDLNQILTYIAPSFQSSRQAISDGTDHVDPAQLRGLGPDQILVLVNGKRRHQSSLVNANGTVNRGTVGTDMNAIPASSVDRIEILRDGAAAQYGSDAIAGVINIVLKKNTGLDAQVSFGQHITSYNKHLVPNSGPIVSLPTSVDARDGQTIQVGLNYGLNIGKGHLNIIGEYNSRGATNRTGTYTGQIWPNVGGVDKSDSINSAKGIDRNTFDMVIGNSEVKGYGAVVNFSYPIGAASEVYAFGGYNNKQGKAAGFYRYPNAVPTGVRAKVLPIYPNGFLPTISSDVADLSATAGFKTKFSGWALDLSQTFGQNSFDFNVGNSVNYTQAADTTYTGALQQSFYAGGTKFTQLTTNADITKNHDVLAGLNTAFGAEFRQDAYAITPGEETSYRNYNTKSGVAAGAQVFGGFLNTNELDESRTSVAVYADLEQDFTKRFMVGAALRFENYSDFGTTLNYKVASRYKAYDNLTFRGSISSGFRAPSQQQKFYSKTGTIFIAKVAGGPLEPVESGTFVNNSAAAKAVGIPELKQETSNSYTLGFTTRLGKNIDFTLDAYQINIQDRIVLTNNFTAANLEQSVKDELFRNNAAVANFFTNAIDTRSRGLEAVLAYNKKFGDHEVRLIAAGSIIRNKVLDSSDIDGNGVKKPYVKASDVLIKNNQVGNYFNREDESRIEVASPSEKVSITGNYKYKKLGLMVRTVRFGQVQYLDPGMNPENFTSFPLNTLTNSRQTLDQTFSAKWVTDLSLSYQITKKLGVSVGANNVFDVYQDEHTHSGNVSLGRFVYSRRVQQMGFNGRYVFGRLVFNM